jgi:hypothetical protein
MTKDKALDLALEALEYADEMIDTVCVPNAITAIKQARSAQVAWKWHQAPVKTSWGQEMVVADLAIDKDNTVSIYCERDQTNKVEAMFTPPAAQRQWVGLDDDDISALGLSIAKAKALESLLKRRNT